MHPLSWNVYGGHVDNIRLLLDYGASPNLDFDSMVDKQPTTVLDVVIQLTKNEQGDERFINIEQLLRQRGAKTINEIPQNDDDDGNNNNPTTTEETNDEL
jgi:ankyrin repeat protein